MCSSLCNGMELPLIILPAYCCACPSCINLSVCRVDAAQQILEARILDLAGACKQGKASYPGFLNGRANWPLDDPDGKPMTQALDCKQLKKTLELCQQVARAKKSTEAASRRAKPAALKFRNKPSWYPPGRRARQVKVCSLEQYL